MAKKIVLSFIVLGIAIGIWHLIQHRSTLTTSSPTGEYSVVLRDELISPILFETLVKFEVTKRGNEFLRSTYLNGWDGALGFQERFPSHNWIEDSALLFESRGYSDSDKAGFEVVNDSGLHLKYLRFTGLDILLVFDLPPGERIGFVTRAQKDNKWFQLSVEFSDNSQIKREFDFTVDDGVLNVNSCSVIRVFKSDVNISVGSLNACE